MANREITLDTAAFLDSPQYRTLADPPREAARTIVDRFLACSYDQLGKAPQHLDGQDLHGIVGHLLPGHFGRRDPLAKHVPEVLRAYLVFLGEHTVVTQMFELRNALEQTLGEFEHTVETGEHAHHAPVKTQKPFVHKAEKTGRNDPCPCGSGKKFKSCHAKA